MKDITTEQAINLYDSGFYKDLTNDEIVKFQLFERLLCMPFEVFQGALQDVLGRPVWSHEFAFKDNLVREYLGEQNPPTMEDIINLIPEDKRLIVVKT